MTIRARLLVSVLSVALGACGGDGGVADAGGPDATPFDAPIMETGPRPDMPAGCRDEDGDGHGARDCGGDDCDDHDVHAYPSNVEVCDAAGHDDDCDPSTLGPDGDGDGFPSLGCCNTQATGSVTCGDDCDDARNFVNPTAPEVCDGVDDDCDGNVDEGIVSSTFYPDCDGDGFGGTGTSGTPATGCSMPTMGPTSCPTGGWSPFATDCADMVATVHPGAMEACNAVDDNCNAMTDEGVGTAYYADCDNDTYGQDATMQSFCAVPTTAPAGCAGFPTARWVAMGGDCDDAHAAAHPLGMEICDGLDDDCNGTSDGADATAWCDAPTHLPTTVVSEACVAGACAITACAAGYQHCSPSSPSCESSIMTDDANCGGCGHACAHAGCAGGICANDYLEIQEAFNTSCARRGSGAVECWGQDYGSTPVAVTGLTDAVALAMDAYRTHLRCAIRRTGAVVCWGNDTADGFTSATPIAVGAFTDARSITFGTDLARNYVHVLHGSVVASYFGNAATTFTLSTTFTGVSDGTQVACGSGTGFCVLRSGGTVSCERADVPGLADATAIACMVSQCIAIHAGGQVVRWMFSPTFPEAPTRAGTYSDATALDAQGLVLHADGTVTDADGTVALATLPAAAAVAGPSGVTSIGVAHDCALLRTGTAVCWGANGSGQLGNGTTTSSATAVPVTGS